MTSYSDNSYQPIHRLFTSNPMPKYYDIMTDKVVSSSVLIKYDSS